MFKVRQWQYPAMVMGLNLYWQDIQTQAVHTGGAQCMNVLGSEHWDFCFMQQLEVAAMHVVQLFVPYWTINP